MGLQVPKLVIVPIGPVFVFNDKILKADVMGWDIHLNIAAGLEVQILSRRQIEDQLLDERGDVTVGTHRAIELLNMKDLIRDMDLQIVTYLDLAGQAVMLFLHLAVNVPGLRRQDMPAALQDLDFALGARPAAAARRRDEYFVDGQRGQQRPSGRGHDRAGVVVDQNFAVARFDDLEFNQDNDRHQHHNDSGKDNGTNGHVKIKRHITLLQPDPGDTHKTHRHQSG